jgi:hypothetical protein
LDVTWVLVYATGIHILITNPDNLEGGSSGKKVKVITKNLKEMQRRCEGLWDVNKMADDCCPSNEQPHAGALTGQLTSTRSQGTESTDFLPHVLNSKKP